MTPIIKNWIQALKRGKYQQNFALLRNKWDHYSAVGVLANLIDEDSWEFNPDGPYWLFKGKEFDLPNNTIKNIPELNLQSSKIKETYCKIITRKKFQPKKNERFTLYTAVCELNDHEVKFPLIAIFIEDILNLNKINN